MTSFASPRRWLESVARSAVRRARLPFPSVWALFVLWTLALSTLARADLIGSNILEVQNGNVPFTEPENRFDIYDQLDLRYLEGRTRVGLRFETYRNSQDLYTYEEITLRYAEWSDEHLRVRAGNFYTILGRGLIHRSFDLPGVVLDQPGLRSRYAASRDVDGVLAEGNAGPFEARFLAGTPNGGEFSPGTTELGLSRYSGQLVGGEGAVSPFGSSRIGFAYARFTPDGMAQQEYGSGFVDFDPLALWGISEVAFPLYVEYAGRDQTFGDWFSFTTAGETPHAFYASTNLLWGPLGLSAEWKDYSQFRNGFSDPPSLVREHAWTLLNRSTHVLDAEREEGFQLEASVSRPEWGAFTANLSRSDGNFGRNHARFEELYLEMHVAPDYGRRWEATVFFDTGKDEFFVVGAREAYGGAATYRFDETVSASVDFQRQPVERGIESFSDTYLSVSGSWANLATVALVWERTTDPQEEDPEEFDDPGIDPRHFVGVNVRAEVLSNHEINVFYGERRGGRACTAGTCYEVLSFKGLEVRVTSVF